MTRRDPRTDPQEGDVLYQANGTRELHVEKVDGEEVGYRVTDGKGSRQMTNYEDQTGWTLELIEEKKREGYFESRLEYECALAAYVLRNRLGSVDFTKVGSEDEIYEMFRAAIERYNNDKK